MNIKSLIVLVFAYLGFSNMWLRSKVNRLDEELSDARSNIEYYQQSLNGTQDQNRVLQLTIEDFKFSNDSLIKELSNTQDQLKIKDKKLKEAMKVSTVLTDTIIDVVPIDRDFNIELKSNQLTTIKISRVGEQITCIPEIYNHQDVYITEEKVYRKKYKNWFQRLIHFDFKKDKVQNFQIINSNDLIHVLDTRIIKITE